jgi:dTDP-glucose pyrophosphorylase
MMSKSEAHLWRTTLVPLGSTVQQAIHSLESSSMQIVLVVSESDRLVGTLTDGDIRRAFLNGFNLDSPVDSIIQRDPLAVPPEISKSQVLLIMQVNKIHHLPIINGEGILIGLHIWDALTAPRTIENVMIIMAGGKGSRLHPYTENCPKPMLEVGGKPMLQYVVEKAVANGFQNIYISLCFLGSMIEQHFGDGSKFGAQIEYIRESTPLGTAGCLGLLPRVSQLPVVVTNGDILTDINYNEVLDFHISNGATATMAVRRHEIQNQFGVVRANGIEIEGFEEKPIYRSCVNAGIYVIEPVALTYLEHGEACDMPTLFSRIKQNLGRTIVYPMHEAWLDVGRPEDLAQAMRWKATNKIVS